MSYIWYNNYGKLKEKSKRHKEQYVEYPMSGYKKINNMKAPKLFCILSAPNFFCILGTKIIMHFGCTNIIFANWNVSIYKQRIFSKNLIIYF